MRHLAARNFAALGACALLAACGQPAQTNQGAPPPAAGPAAPGWAQGLKDQAYATAFPNAFTCNGYVDGPTDRDTASVAVVGWAWVPAAHAGVQHVVLVDSTGRMVGFGDGGVPRPDVPQARKDITRPDVGWRAVSTTQAGALTAYGVDLQGKAGCRLGEVRL